MLKLFQYNWQVRDEWFAWCNEIPEEELLKKRIGGVGGILHTLFHIIDVEYSWICDMKGKPPFDEPFESYSSLSKVQNLSERLRQEVEPFVLSWQSNMEDRVYTEQWPDGELEIFKHGEIMRHVIAHEIHHMGQLSIWAREIGKKPVTANLIRRGLFKN